MKKNNAVVHRQNGFGVQLLLVLLASITAGCGGGGGGSASGGTTTSSTSSASSTSSRTPLTITISPVSATVAQVDLPAIVPISAEVTGSVSVTTVYVLISLSSGAFTPGTSSVSQLGPTTYGVGAQTLDSLSVGQHLGTVQIKVCSDPQCGDVLGEATGPYNVTVAPSPAVTATSSPNNFIVTTIEGDQPIDWSVIYTVQAPAYNAQYAKFNDPAGVLTIRGSSQIVQSGIGNILPSIVVSSTLLPGIYRGNLDVIFCRDSACSKTYNGGARLPYTVTVMPQTNLTSLRPLNGANDWLALQGDSTRSGYVNVILNPADFTPRWLWKAPDEITLPYLLDPVSSLGKVFTIAAANNGSVAPTLAAISESDGTVIWQKTLPGAAVGNLPGPINIAAPAISNGAVYVAHNGNNGSVAGLLDEAFNISDGSTKFSAFNQNFSPAGFYEHFFNGLQAFRNSATPYLTPYADSMLFNVGNSGNRFGATSALFVNLDGATGSATQIWSGCPNANRPSPFGGAAAVDEQNNVYLAVDTGLLEANTCQLIASAFLLTDGYGPAIVSGTSDVVVVGGGNLAMFDTANGTIKWSVRAGSSTPTDNFVGSPAISGSVIYVQNSGRMQLEARSATDGHVLWTWKPVWSDEIGFSGNVIATQNLVFVSTNKRTYAIDISTHQAVWMYPYAGRLAISANGILYIRRAIGFTSEGILAAINLH